MLMGRTLHVQMMHVQHVYMLPERGWVDYSRAVFMYATHYLEDMPRLTDAQRNNAIGRMEAGESQSDIAVVLNVTQSTISRLWSRYQQTGTSRDHPRSGRPRVTTVAQDRYIRLRHLRQRFLTASSTTNAIPGLRRISDQTVRNRLREADIRPRRPARRIILTREHRRQRLLWCRRCRLWRVQQWRRVAFSDESRFMLRRADGRARVYRRRGERYAANCVQEADRFGGGSVMMWASICHTGRTNLVHIPGNLNAVRYCNEILQPHVIPFLNANNVIFQHDNARPHTARVVTAFFNQNNVVVLPWPSRSPDLNPIEHLWDELDRRVRRRLPEPQTLQQLVRALQEEWTAIPQEVIQTLIRSMGSRCQTVINSNGGHTRY